MLLSNALELFIESKIGISSDENLRWYKTMLKPMLNFLGDVEIESITVHDLRRWRASLAEKETRWEKHPHRRKKQGGLAQSTLRAHVNACRIFFKWLGDERILKESPARRLELPAKPQGEPKRDISLEDARCILEAAQASNIRDYAMLCFLADTGCRVSGVAGLQLDRLNLIPDENGRYRAKVREKGRGRGKTRTAYFGPETARAMGGYLAVRPEPDVDTNCVFLKQQPGRAVEPLETEGIYRMIERYAKLLGITGNWNPHAWRHAFAHNLIDQGVDISIVTRLMGHSSSAITIDFYGPRADKVLAEAHARGSWLNGRNGGSGQTN